MARCACGRALTYYLTVVLNRLLRRLIGVVRRRLYRKPELRNPEILPLPIRLLFLALIVHLITSKVGLPLLARQLWSASAAVVTIIAVAWLLILFSRLGEDYLRRRLISRNRTGTAAVCVLRADW